MHLNVHQLCSLKQFECAMVIDGVEPSTLPIDLAIDLAIVHLGSATAPS
jgi:hypothetical protein